MPFARELTDHGWRTRCKHPVVRSIKSHAGSDAEPVTSLETSSHRQYRGKEDHGQGRDGRVSLKGFMQHTIVLSWPLAR